jgi:hypothetical protein
MYVLIDTTNLRALARHESSRAVQALHYIQFPNVSAVVIREGENRNWTVLDAKQIHAIAVSVGYAGPPIAALNHAIRNVREHVENAAWLVLPFPLARLDEQAFAIVRTDARPMAFNPEGSQPVLLRQWHSPPQVNSPRSESEFALCWSAGLGAGQLVRGPTAEASPAATMRGQSTLRPIHNEDEPMAAKPAAKKAATKKAAPKKAAATKKAVTKKAPAVPKGKAGAAPLAPREERNGIKRPKPGGNCAAVWDACDAVRASKKDTPSFKEVDEALGKAAIPAATRRSNYAVWRRFHGITGRVA